jgi:hypothetical protein
LDAGTLESRSALALCSTLTLRMAFFIMAKWSEFDELHMASLEYACFWLIVTLPLFQVYELDKTMQDNKTKKKTKS